MNGIMNCYLTPDRLREPYTVVNTDVFYGLVELANGLMDILQKHSNDNKQLDDMEYDWLLLRLDGIRQLTRDKE